MKKIGLALGGGGTKGFIHLGVLKYLEEKKYEITEISGTSMGAMIGTMVALGMSYEEIYQEAKKLNYKDLVDIDLKTGLVKGDKLMKRMKLICGDCSFEDLKIPLKILVTNLESGEGEVFESGSVLQAIRYSISLPGVFATDQSKTKNRYADGGIVTNLPVLCLTEKNKIAVSCMGLSEFSPKTTRNILGFSIDTSWIEKSKDILGRTLDIMMLHLENTKLAEAKGVSLIRPAISNINMLDLAVLDDAIKIGYNEAVNVLGE